jgi:hypothetical protein
MSETADALEALLASEGWRLYAEHVKAEWSPAACWRKVKEAGANVEQVDYTNGQVGLLMTWPAQEIARARRAEAVNEPSMSRRGGL